MQNETPQRKKGNRGSPPKSSPRGGNHSIDDTPIQALSNVIETVPAEQWTVRCNAFQSLVEAIPKTSTSSSSSAPITPAWYNSPKALRYLNHPLSKLLKDSRSSVVKRVCEYCIIMFERIGMDARYLLKDLMPAIMTVHAQTVQIIRANVQTMVCEALRAVPCKAAMPIWLERLKTDRSKTVREACVIYLGVALECWKDFPDTSYLTDEIWNQVGAMFMRSLRDPAPSVRQHIKTSLQLFRKLRPALWSNLVKDPDGPVGKDPKLQRVLMKITTGNGGSDDGMDDLSVSSRASLASFSSSSTRSNLSSRIPKSIGGGPNTKSSNRKTRSVGPSVRGSPAPHEPIHKQASVRNRRTLVTATSYRSKSQGAIIGQSGRNLNTARIYPRQEEEKKEKSHPDSPFANGVAALKEAQMKHIHGNGQALSKSFQERLSRNGNHSESAQEEYMTIGKDFLQSHKKSVDRLMEVIRFEMDALQEFEGSVGRQKIGEEQVLNYFESVGLCLDERKAIARDLEEAMERLSTGGN